MTLGPIVCLLALGAAIGPAIAAPVPERTDAALERRLGEIAAAAPGRLGVMAKNLRTGAVARVNAGDRVHLMSVCKLPIAIATLEGVDRSSWALERRLRLRARDMHPGVSRLTERHPGGGIVAIHELLELMVTRSDNTASDALLRLVGGPRSMGAWLRARGFAGIRIDRSETRLGNDWYGLMSPPPESTWTVAKLRALRQAVPAAVRDRAAAAMANDPRDTATPEALVRLLERLWTGRLLSPAMTDTARALLARCATSPQRLPGKLPRGTPVPRKTGTSGTRGGVFIAVNDVGVIRLPNGDEAAIAVMVRNARGPLARAEATIATVARAVYDAWGAKR